MDNIVDSTSVEHKIRHSSEREKDSGESSSGNWSERWWPSLDPEHPPPNRSERRSGGLDKRTSQTGRRGNKESGTRLHGREEEVGGSIESQSQDYCPWSIRGSQLTHT